MSLRPVVVLAAVMLAAPALADGPFRTVALNDDPVPGLPGYEYSRFAPAWLDKDGNAVYTASVNVIGGGGGTNGIWSETGGLSLEYVDGDPAPTLPAGTELDFIRRITVNRNGEIVVVNDLDGPYPTVDFSNDSAIWTNTSGPLQFVAQEGGTAPGGPVGAVFDSLASFTNPAVNGSGKMAFMADMRTGVGGVTSSDNRGIWRGTNSTDLSLVVREGDQVAGAPLGQLHSGFVEPTINENGEVAFRGFVTGTGITSANDTVLWAESGGSLSVAVQEGDPIPGGSGEVFGGYFQNEAMNTNGKLVFKHRLLTGTGGVTTDNDETIWTGAPGSLTMLAREGTQAAGAPVGAVHSFLSLPVINEQDHVAFFGGLEVGTGGITTANDRGIWSTGSGSLELIVQEGDPAPGVPGAIFENVSSLALNDAGHVVFAGTLAIGPGGVDSTNRNGVWAQMPDGTLWIVARNGDVIDVDDGPGTDLRTLTGINYTGWSSPHGNDFGRSQFFNEQGKVVFIGHFGGAPGSYSDQGVFVWDPALVVVPEPGGVALLALGGLLWVGRRPRR